MKLPSRKYIKFKYFLFAIKTLYFKALYQGRITIPSLRIAFEKGCKLILDKKGEIIFDKNNYFTRHCNIECYGAKIKFGRNNFFNKNCSIVCRQAVNFGDNVICGPNVNIYDHNHGIGLHQGPFVIQDYTSAGITIGNNVWLGANTTVLAGVKINDNVVVGANSVVTSDLSSNCLYGGNPAKFIKNLS